MLYAKGIETTSLRTDADLISKATTRWMLLTSIKASPA